jgi:hypothetical protein
MNGFVSASQELGAQNQIENLIWKIGELGFYPYYEEKGFAKCSLFKKVIRSHISKEQLGKLTKNKKL